MLPHKHFLISAAVMAPFSIKTPEWILVAGLTSAVIDLDVIALVWVNAGKHDNLMQFKNPINIFSRFKVFMETIHKTGVLKYAMMTHFLLAALVAITAGIFCRPYLIPVAVGAVTHILSDIPNMRLLKKAGGSKIRHAAQKFSIAILSVPAIRSRAGHRKINFPLAPKTAACTG